MLCAAHCIALTQFAISLAANSISVACNPTSLCCCLAFAALQIISSSMRQLQHINLHNDGHVTDDGLPALSQLSCLTSLDLQGSISITNRCGKRTAFITHILLSVEIEQHCPLVITNRWAGQLMLRRGSTCSNNSSITNSAGPEWCFVVRRAATGGMISLMLGAAGAGVWGGVRIAPQTPIESVDDETIVPIWKHTLLLQAAYGPLPVCLPGCLPGCRVFAACCSLLLLFCCQLHQGHGSAC
jgi:hypothetical protein